MDEDMSRIAQRVIHFSVFAVNEQVSRGSADV